MVKPQPFEIFGHSGLTPSLFKKYDMSYHTVFMYFSKTEWLGLPNSPVVFVGLMMLDDATRSSMAAARDRKNPSSCHMQS